MLFQNLTTPHPEMESIFPPPEPESKPVTAITKSLAEVLYVGDYLG